MRIGRRGFMHALAGTAAWLAGGKARASEPEWTCEIHQQTRNTRLGPVGRKWWPASRKRRRAKAYSGYERIALPAPASFGGRPLADVLDDFRVTDGFAREPLGLAEISRLLHFTNGVTQPPILRAAPSAGALYAGEIYILAQRVTGLDPGVYYYAPPGHALVPVRPGPPIDVVRGALERPGQFASAPAVLLLTNVFGRYGWRYANRAYRYALIDTGHIGENLRLAARSAGLVDVAPLRFHDERLCEVLGIDGRREAACALHAVGQPGKAAPSPQVRSFGEAKKAPAGWGDTERYHASSCLVEAVGGTPRPGIRTAPVRGNVVTLRPETTVEACILNRRSAQRFADRKLQRDVLDWILDAAVGHPALTRAPGVELLLAVHRVAALEPGLYRYQAGDARLVSLRNTDLRASLVRACLGQDKAGACAVAFFLVADLRPAIKTLGERGYRDLLIEAGGIGQRIYLAAEAASLAARNLAAFRDDALNGLLDLDGRERAVLHLTLAGHEA